MSTLSMPSSVARFGRALHLLRAVFATIGSRISHEYRRHQAIRRYRRELDGLLEAGDHALRDVGMTRIEAIHQRNAIRVWF